MSVIMVEPLLYFTCGNCGSYVSVEPPKPSIETGDESDAECDSECEPSHCACNVHCDRCSDHCSGCNDDDCDRSCKRERCDEPVVCCEACHCSRCPEVERFAVLDEIKCPNCHAVNIYGET